jgi:hypothetical protein
MYQLIKNPHMYQHCSQQACGVKILQGDEMLVIHDNFRGRPGEQVLCISCGTEHLKREEQRLIDGIVSHASHVIASILLNNARIHRPDKPFRTLSTGLTADDHLEHAQTHMLLDSKGDDAEPHLAHALTRLAMHLFCEAQKGGVHE